MKSWILITATKICPEYIEEFVNFMCKFVNAQFHEKNKDITHFNHKIKKKFCHVHVYDFINFIRDFVNYIYGYKNLSQKYSNIQDFLGQVYE